MPLKGRKSAPVVHFSDNSAHEQASNVDEGIRLGRKYKDFSGQGWGASRLDAPSPFLQNPGVPWDRRLEYTSR